MKEGVKPYWGPTKTLKTPEDVRGAIETEVRLFGSKKVPTIAKAIRSVEMGFQHDVKPMFKGCNHFKGPYGR